MTDLILAIETTGHACSVALSSRGSLLSETTLFAGNRHDEMLSHLINQTLDYNGQTVENLDAVAISAGPGSFTGLRIGGSVAKGLCFSGKPKLIAVSTLKAAANKAIPYCNKNRIIAIIPSHKDIYYYQIFNDRGKLTDEIQISDFEHIESLIDGNFIISGPGAKDFSPGEYPNLKNITAADIAELGYEMYKNNEFTDPTDFEPMYIQEFKPKIKQKKLNI